ncbi:MAG: MerR family transcriptional regulator [Acidimicrobiaceae bacterium]|nr:MerR family transcriptional regulator [Acidimicrobiaceae bacterium]
MAAVDAREYRSIGETLELIHEEFPEVTISKIRFLETQGLIAPERTTNGYRKFYNHDIDRLTFVLRQQREQFLPLKVIKDRITEKEPGVFVLDPAKGRFAKSQKTKSSKFEKDIFGDPFSNAQQFMPRKNSNHKVEPKAHHVQETAPAHEVSTRGRTPVAQATPDRRSPNPLPPEHSQRQPDSTRLDQQTGHTGASEISVPAAENGQGHEKPSPTKRPRLFALPSASSLAEKPDDSASVREGAEDSFETGEFGNDSGEANFPKNSFTARDIAELADLSMVQVEDLTTFGLLTPTSVRGQHIYCTADLELATLAKQFARFGLEARHLKMYKVSAEREASFLEQVILPILANKSQKSRARAEAALTQLGEIGAQFRTLLLERAIEKILKS